MKELNLKISISHLFSNLLNEESGNLLVLKKRCEWRGIEVEFNEVNSIEEFVQSDIYFVGNGSETQLKEVATHYCKSVNSDELVDLVEEMAL